MSVPKHILDQAQKVHDDHARARRLFENRQDLNRLGKQQRAAKVYLNAKSQLEELHKQVAVENERRTAELTTKVFGIDDIAGSNAVDRASASMSYRDALDRAGKAKTPQESQALLVQARASGDELQARAVAQDAFHRPSIGPLDGGWLEVVDNYSADRPESREPLVELHSRRSDNMSTQMLRDQMFFFISQPSELSGLTNSQIQQLAEGQ